MTCEEKKCVNVTLFVCFWLLVLSLCGGLDGVGNACKTHILVSSQLCVRGVADELPDAFKAVQYI